MATESLPTVKIDDGDGGFYIINESDFCADKHVKFGEEKPKPKRGRKPKSSDDA